jgi:PAS domain S-box-containing protein
MKGKALNILLVEDNTHHAALITSTLKNSDLSWQITHAKTLSDAKSILAHQLPDLMLLDNRLPDGEGLELLPGSVDSRTFPIIMMTSNGNEKMAVNAMKAGALDYVIKSDSMFAEMPHMAERVLREWDHILDRKQAERALNQFKYIVSTSSDMLAMMDKDYIYITANPAYLKRFNKTLDELIGHTVAEVFGEQVFNEKIKVNAERCLTGENVNYQAWFDSPNAKAQYIDIHYYPYLDADNEIAGFIVNERDLTVQKKAEQLALRRELQAKRIIETVFDAFIQIDVDDLIREWNPQAEMIFGWKKEDVLGHSLNEIIIPQDKRQQHREGLKRFLASGEEHILNKTIEFQALKRGGDMLPIELMIVVEKDNGDTYFNAFLRDITHKKIALEAGRIGTWYAELNTDNEWVWSWDRLTNEMLGLKSKDIGKFDKWLDKIHPKDLKGMNHAIEESLSTGKLFNQKYRTVMPGGAIRYLIGTGQMGEKTFGKYHRIDGICIDQSAFHQTQQKLKQLNSELEERVEQRTKELVLSKEHAEQASKIKTDFLSMMSHELRTPMNGVIGSLDLLTTTKQTEESMDLIDTAKTSAVNLVHILNDILDISKIEAGKLEIEERAFTISEVIDNVVNVFIPTVKKKDIVFEVYEDPNIPTFVLGDAMRVRQILFNLLGNAIKFTSTSNEKRGCIKLLAEVKESNKYVSTITFNIVDNGIGIEPETQQKLFMPFSQAERSTTRKYGGTGLGLAICAQLTEMMGGCIHLTSEKGIGSSFCVEVPFWLSQETRALDVETLSSVNVAFVDVSEVDSNRKETLSHYLVDQGAEVTYVAYNLDFDFSADFDVILIFVGDLAVGRKNTEILLSLLSKMNKIILAIDDIHLTESKKTFPNMRIISTQPITRTQFIGEINNSWQKSHELVLDEINLEDLEGCIENEQIKSLNADILIVEDNELNQKIILKQMSNLGYECDIAEDGEQGIEKWNNNRDKYKLILTDCHMPKMDGYQMTQEIRKLEDSNNLAHIPIIAVTGAAMTGDAEHCYKAGMNSFVSKPVQLTDLREVLKEWYHND